MLVDRGKQLFEREATDVTPLTEIAEINNRGSWMEAKGIKVGSEGEAKLHF